MIRFLLIQAILLLLGLPLISQNLGEGKDLFFLSDCQEPMKAEKVFLNTYRNTEARDSLFVDIIRQRPQYLFLLGDMVSQGSKKRKWEPVISFTSTLRKSYSRIYAIPGNHEYYSNDKKGMRNFLNYFPESTTNGYYIKVDSVAVVMLNSNTGKMEKWEVVQQVNWYRKVMDSLDINNSIGSIIVCTHHSPFTNSKIVEPSEFVNDSIVPRYVQSPKTKLFISGHSHNLELFKKSDKFFLVAGGGGGLIQPLLPEERKLYSDVLIQDLKPLYFYIRVRVNGSKVSVNARGLDREFLKVRNFDSLNIR